MARYDAHLSSDPVAFSDFGYRNIGKGSIIFYTHNSWGQDYGKAYYRGELNKVYFLRGEDRHFWQSARYYKGSRYRHRSGSKYQVRKTTHIKWSSHGGKIRGTIPLRAGDWVGINQGQGYCTEMGGKYFRCDGYYRNGRWNEVTGGFVYMPTWTHSSNFSLRTN